MSYLVLQEAYQRFYMQWSLMGFSHEESREIAKKQVVAVYL